MSQEKYIGMDVHQSFRSVTPRDLDEQQPGMACRPIL